MQRIQHLLLPSLPLQGVESLKDKDTEGSHNTGRRHPSSSFVDSVMVALTAEEKGEDRNVPSAELAGDSYWTYTGSVFWILESNCQAVC